MDKRTWMTCGTAWALCVLAVVLAAGLLAASPARAGEGCKWNYDALRCDPGIIGNGCIGIRNKTGQDVKFGVFTRNHGHGYRKLSKGKSEKADFDEPMDITGCYVRDDAGDWVKIHCNYDAFEVIKNEKSGGGCGCKFFRCLPKMD